MQEFKITGIHDLEKVKREYAFFVYSIFNHDKVKTCRALKIDKKTLRRWEVDALAVAKPINNPIEHHYNQSGAQ